MAVSGRICVGPTSKFVTNCLQACQIWCFHHKQHNRFATLPTIATALVLRFLMSFIVFLFCFYSKISITHLAECSTLYQVQIIMMQMCGRHLDITLMFSVSIATATSTSHPVHPDWEILHYRMLKCCVQVCQIWCFHHKLHNRFMPPHYSYSCPSFLVLDELLAACAMGTSSLWLATSGEVCLTFLIGFAGSMTKLNFIAAAWLYTATVFIDARLV